MLCMNITHNWYPEQILDLLLLFSLYTTFILSNQIHWFSIVFSNVHHVKKWSAFRSFRYYLKWNEDMNIYVYIWTYLKLFAPLFSNFITWTPRVSEFEVCVQYWRTDSMGDTGIETRFIQKQIKEQGRLRFWSIW